MYKLILMDLDGTLLRDDKRISARTMAALGKCREEGSLIGIATSRGAANIVPFVEALCPDIVISSGGALAVCGEKILYTSLFSEEDTGALLRRAREVAGPNCEIAVDTLEKHYWNYKIDPHTEDSTWGECIHTDYADFREKALKICVELFDPVQAQKIAACVPDCDCLHYSGGFWYKFTRKSATKECAVSALCATLSIAPEETIAFGDDFADIGMLKTCGMGVAMGNAVEEVKQIADSVTDTNENDGVAVFLERYCLQRNRE